MTNRTPQEWLLARHADAEPMLDELRLAALPEPRLSGREFLRELFLPAWPAWAVLAAAWIVLVVLGAARPAEPHPSHPAPQYAVAWPTSDSQIDALLEETRALR